MSVAKWARARRAKTYGERVAAKFERLGKPGGSYSEFASKEAWKNNSVTAHDEAAKAFDFEGKWDRTREHEDAIDAIERGEKTSPPGGGAFDDDAHPRDDKGRFAPK